MRKRWRGRYADWLHQLEGAFRSCALTLQIGSHGRTPLCRNLLFVSERRDEKVALSNKTNVAAIGNVAYQQRGAEKALFLCLPLKNWLANVIQLLRLKY